MYIYVYPFMRRLMNQWVTSRQLSSTTSCHQYAVDRARDNLLECEQCGHHFILRNAVDGNSFNYVGLFHHVLQCNAHIVSWHLSVCNSTMWSSTVNGSAHQWKRRDSYHQPLLQVTELGISWRRNSSSKLLNIAQRVLSPLTHLKRVITTSSNLSH